MPLCIVVADTHVNHGGSLNTPTAYTLYVGYACPGYDISIVMSRGQALVTQCASR
jgi:hypothetical protein